MNPRYHRILAVLLGWPPNKPYVFHAMPAMPGCWTFRERLGHKFTTGLSPQNYPGIEGIEDPEEVILFAIERLADFRMEASRGTS